MNYYKLPEDCKEIHQVCSTCTYNVGTAIAYLYRAGKKQYINNKDNEPSELLSAEADINKAINHLQFELKRIKSECTKELINIAYEHG
jgi:peptidoglycan hydrolase CwlO-like protein